MSNNDEDVLPPSKGKTKGGPSKVPSLKATPAKRVAVPKGEGGGAKGIKAPRVGSPSKISGARKTAPRAHVSVKKAESRFSLPKPGLPKAKGKRR